MTSFADTLRSAGLMPADIVDDGKWHRCRTEDKRSKKNGAYLLMPGGRLGFWRNWATDAGVNTWRDERPVTRAEQLRNEARAAQIREREKEKRRRGIAASRELWERGRVQPLHPYIRNKGLTSEGAGSLRQWNGTVYVEREEGTGYLGIHADWLLVPIYWRRSDNTEALVNVQRISPDGMKRQMPGAPQSGCWLRLDRPKAALTVFVEGLATGLAVYQSVRSARVVVAFFADNLVPVIQRYRPTGSVCIAADNDHQTMARRGFNPGIQKAQNAAELIGCGVAWPKGIEGTDYADYIREAGQRAHKDIERQILAAARYVTVRGHVP